jgi:pimeloyl-ACP methyl ester carboxylesterase
VQGNVLKNSITEMQMVVIGNTKQSVIIRGENRNNPVLLLIHGGPGSSETALFRYYNAALEKDFVVVYWDQRACGKSYIKRDATSPLCVQMFVQDLCNLALYLKKYLGKEKIYLLAHSWGTLLGILAVAQHPDLFYAYVGTGQVASMPESELESYRFVLRAARERKNAKAIRELETIREPQNGVYACGITGIRTQRKWLNYFGGAIYGSKSMSKFILKFFTSQEYNLADIVRFFKSLNAPARNKLSQGEFLKTDLFDKIKKIDMPSIFSLAGMTIRSHLL